MSLTCPSILNPPTPPLEVVTKLWLWVPCFVHRLSRVLFYVQYYVYFSALLSNHPTFSFSPWSLPKLTLPSSVHSCSDYRSLRAAVSCQSLGGGGDLILYPNRPPLSEEPEDKAASTPSLSCFLTVRAPCLYQCTLPGRAWFLRIPEAVSSQVIPACWKKLRTENIWNGRPDGAGWPLPPAAPHAQGTWACPSGLGFQSAT